MLLNKVFSTVCKWRLHQELFLLDKFSIRNRKTFLERSTSLSCFCIVWQELIESFENGNVEIWYSGIANGHHITGWIIAYGDCLWFNFILTFSKAWTTLSYLCKIPIVPFICLHINMLIMMMNCYIRSTCCHLEEKWWQRDMVHSNSTSPTTNMETALWQLMSASGQNAEESNGKTSGSRLYACQRNVFSDKWLRWQIKHGFTHILSLFHFLQYSDFGRCDQHGSSQGQCIFNLEPAKRNWTERFKMAYHKGSIKQSSLSHLTSSVLKFLR